MLRTCKKIIKSPENIGLWQIIQKDRVLLVGGFERATLPFAGFQRAEPFGGYGVEKKSGENFLLGKVSFARAFRNGIDKGSRGYALAQ